MKLLLAILVSIWKYQENKLLLTLMLTAQRDKVIDRWNRTTLNYSTPKNIHSNAIAYRIESIFKVKLTKIVILVKIRPHCNHFVALDLMIFAGMLLQLAYLDGQNSRFHNLRPRCYRSESILHNYWDQEC